MLSPNMYRRPAPVDEFSGVPLVIDPRYIAAHRSDQGVNDNHGWFGRRHPQLQNLSGWALKASRVQVTDLIVHNKHFHEALDNPEIPVTDGARGKPIVFAIGGYVPQKGLIFEMTRQGKYRALEQDLPRNLRVNMVGESLGDVKVDKPQIVAWFLGEQLVVKGCRLGIEEILRELASSRATESDYADCERLQYAAHELMAPFQADYQAAYDEGLLPVGRPTAADTVLQFVGQHYNGPSTMPAHVVAKIPA